MRLHLLLLLPLASLYAVNAEDADTERDLVSEYIHVPTSCETKSCVAGGCLFENCATPLSCRGGLCYFRCVRNQLSGFVRVLVLFV